jgi:hypothetical protein
MISAIKITSLTNIGANLSYNSVFPIVDINGTANTYKANIQLLGNYILNGAGGSYFTRAAQANIALSVANAAQPNITSVGTLTSLAVTGNLNVDVGTMKISGGTNGYVLQTDGLGNLSWTSQTGGNGGNGTPGGSNTQVQFNDSGSFGGNSGFTYDKAIGTLAVPYISGDGGNLSNISGANVNGTVANANLSQLLTVTPVSDNYSYHVVLTAGDGDNSLHIDQTDNLQYNPEAGLLTATRMDADYFVGNLQYSYGYPLSNVVGIGNIASVNLSGSSSNVLYGNGVFAPASGAGGSIIANVSSNVTIPTANGNVYINANDGTNYQWKFDSTGNLTLPGNTVAINFANGLAAFSNLVQWTTAPVSNTSPGNAGEAAYDAGGNLYVCVAGNTWSKFTGTVNW